jgi:E3 ubiquitin-protein ligase NEDD4
MTRTDVHISSTTIHATPPGPAHPPVTQRLSPLPPPAPPILSMNTTNTDGTYADVHLPLGWEERRMPDGRPYFVDHHTRTTTRNDL